MSDRRILALRLALVLLAALAQFQQVTRDRRFHPDEAYFMTFARGAAVNGDWLLPGNLDKAPLAIYFSALSMVGIGVGADADGVLQLDNLLGEFAGRLPNALLAILLVALLMRLAGRLYRSEYAVFFAGLLSATSPYLLAYGASAFTDMSLLFCLALALYCAVSNRWTLLGVALALAFCSKQQAILFVLPVMLLLARAPSRDWLRAGFAFAAIACPLLLWDAARPETSIFLQAAVNNAPAQFWVAPASWLERLGEWLRLSTWFFPQPWLTVLLIAVAGLARVRPAGQLSALEKAFLLYLIAYLLAHSVFNFNLYDRYLLLILPLALLLVAGGLARLLHSLGRGPAWIIVLLLLLLFGGSWALDSGSPIGADHGDYIGIDRLADHLNSKPVATVIYDPWLGWQLGYYLGQWHDKRRVHYPDAESLVAGAVGLDEIGDRYFVAPVDQPHQHWLAALRAAGFGIAVDYEKDRFISYRLSPPTTD